MSDILRDKLDTANSKARYGCTETIFGLTSISRDYDRTPPFLMDLRLRAARRNMEELLAAIIEAQEALAAQGKPDLDDSLTRIAAEMARDGIEVGASA